MRNAIDWILGALAGALLAVMISINAGLAGHSTPFIGSWVVHGVGALAALVLVFGQRLFAKPAPATAAPSRNPPLWSYFGGAPGALAVALGSIAVNSELALAGALSLMLVGQIVFSLLCDQWGLFGTPRRKVTVFDMLAAAMVLLGSLSIITSGGAA
jgi:transporter family-2 protein